MSQATDVYRFYYGAKRNVSKSAETIHRYLFQKNGIISRRTKEDAELLNKFFKDLKNIYVSNPNNIGGLAKGILLDQEIEQIPVLNFALGGKSLGGVLFEQELLKLFSYKTQDELDAALNGVGGQATASAYIDLGTDNYDEAVKLITETLDKVTDKAIEKLESQLVKGSDVNIGKPEGYLLKVGAKRFGKIDVMAGAGAEININIEGKPTGDLAKAFDLLKNSSFSVKSYLTQGQVHLGRTSMVKAVSAVSEYVAARQPNARWAGIYFLHHPHNGKGSRETIKSRRVLYEHYNHMRKVYELTGIGLRYDDTEDLYSVDFLLVNRAGSLNDIFVYSTQDLVNRLQLNDFKRYDI